MSAEDDGRIFNPRECDNCTGGGCTLCHGDGEFCGSCRAPVSACVCGACEDWIAERAKAARGGKRPRKKP